MPQLSTVADVRSLLTTEVDLDGAGVRLRAPREDDVPAIVQLGQDPDMVRWTGVPSPYGPSEARQFLARTAAQHAAGERRTWVVEPVGGPGSFAGMCALRVAGAGLVEVSYSALPALRGRGLTTAAVRAACAYAFEQGAQAVLWHALVGNFASRRVAWRCGFDLGLPVWRGGPGARGHQLEQVWPGTLRRGEPMRPRHPWLSTPTFELGDVRVRPLSEPDAGRLVVAAGQGEAADWPAFGSDQEALRWLTAARELPSRAVRRGVVLAVADAASDQLLGAVRLDVADDDAPSCGELRYWLLPEARGRGVLARVLDHVLPWALRASDEGGLGLDGLQAGCAATNRPAARVLRRAGMSLVGVRRLATHSPDGPVDGLLFDLVRGDDRAAATREPGRVPTMQTERFRLREWRDTDVPGPDEGPDKDSLAFMPAGVHPDASTFAGWLVQRRVHLDSGEHLNWCLADRETDHALGNVVVFDLGAPQERFQGELGYWLHPPARGHGALQEVLPMVVDHAFRPVGEGGLGLSRLHAGTDLDNAASQALLLRLGFRRWGQDRQAFRNGAGEITDGALFELLASDERLDRRPLGGARLDHITVEGRHLRLRPWREDDVPRIVQSCTDPRSRRWLALLPEPYGAAEARGFLVRRRQRIAAGEGLDFAVADAGSDLCLGAVSLELGGLDQTCAEVGYWAHPDARGRGVMTEAVELLVAHAMRPREAGGLGLRRLQLSAAVANAASVHVAESAGFVRGGVRRAAGPGGGGFEDVVDFDLLNPAWRPEPLV